MAGVRPERLAAVACRPRHAHNVEERVLVLEGQATAVAGDDHHDLEAGGATGSP